MQQQMDKTTLLHNIRTKHDEFETLLAPLNEEQMTTTGVSEAWSIKDLLAHLTAWHRVLLDRLHAAINGTEPTSYPEEGLDSINARFYEQNKDRPLAEVKAEFEDTYQQILAAVEQLNNDDLNNPHRFSWWEGEPYWPNIAGNTYEHIDEHIEPIQKWIAQQK